MAAVLARVSNKDLSNPLPISSIKKGDTKHRNRKNEKQIYQKKLNVRMNLNAILPGNLQDYIPTDKESIHW
jgi:hypothetical protein